MVIEYGVRLIGILYLALGIIGFLPVEAINPVHHEGVGATYLFNLVAINALHNIVHLTIGITALLSVRSSARARLWGKVAGSVLLLLFVAGIIQAIAEDFPRDQLLLGLVPLNSPGHVLHLVSGSLAIYLGFLRLRAEE